MSQNGKEWGAQFSRGQCCRANCKLSTTYPGVQFQVKKLYKGPVFSYHVFGISHYKYICLAVTSGNVQAEISRT